VDDLVDTLQRIVVIKIAKQRAAAPASAAMDALQQLEEFPTKELIETVRGCLAQDSINSDDTLVLLQLVEKKHPFLELGYKDYVGDGDWDRLADAMANVARRFGFARVCKSQLGDKAEEILGLFRDAHDPRAWAAWDVFVDEGDEADFADTLRHCARPLPNLGARASEAKDVLRRLVIALHVEQRVDDVQGQALRELVESGSPECVALAQAYLSGRKSPTDAAALADGVLKVLSAQDELLALRMRDFCEHTMESKQEVDKLLGLIDARDERVLEAFDSFYEVMANGGSREEGQTLLKAELAGLARGVELFGVDAEQVEEEGEEGEEGEDDDEGEDGLKLLFDYIKEWGLSEPELDRLRRLIEQREPGVSKALDLFANDQDPEAFKVALIRAAKTQDAHL
jgi:hypothetical protein